MADNHRLKQQLHFIKEIDKLKQVIRKIPILDGSRLENTAEHSWHIALMAALLAEHAKEKIDVAKTVKMLLIHDIVEIDAGDTFAYDDEHAKTKAEREKKAAERLFNLLPPDQAKEFRDLWEEFEAGKTPEARFAVAVDRLHPCITNYHNKGIIWREYGIRKDRVLERNRPIESASPILWHYFNEMIDDAIAKGQLKS